MQLFFQCRLHVLTLVGLFFHLLQHHCSLITNISPQRVPRKPPHDVFLRFQDESALIFYLPCGCCTGSYWVMQAVVTVTVIWWHVHFFSSISISGLSPNCHFVTASVSNVVSGHRIPMTQLLGLCCFMLEKFLRSSISTNPPFVQRARPPQAASVYHLCSSSSQSMTSFSKLSS